MRRSFAACSLALWVILPAANGALARPPASVPACPTDPALDAKARALFEGLRDDDPGKAMAFFMPRPEFLLVKDIGDPGAYWDELTAWFRDDVHRLHRQLPDLAGATYAGFTLSADDRWTPIGKEANKAAYHSLRNSTLAWTGVDGVRHTTAVRVVIDFQGAWWITHLRWPQEGARADLARTASASRPTR